MGWEGGAYKKKKKIAGMAEEKEGWGMCVCREREKELRIDPLSTA